MFVLQSSNDHCAVDDRRQDQTYKAMNKFRSLLLGAALPVALFLGFSFRPTPVSDAYTYRQFSTIESVVPGGLGRSRVIISDQNDQEVEKDLLNFYSMVVSLPSVKSV